MRPYTKAYYLKQLRQFSGWQEIPRNDSAELNDESIVYLQDNFTVVREPFEEEDFIFNSVTPEWKQFCEGTLGFAIPEDLKFMYEEEVPASA
ncbi:MAG TPA: hypothetical protein PK413_15095 [Thermoanaerobaculia bacterium]|nr:hypothetical protein [Thermoanaerobaculia bacterium]